MGQRSQAILAGVFLLVAAVFMAGSLGLPMGTAERPGAGFYPLFLAVLFLALGGIFLLQSRAPGPRGGEPVPKGQDLRRVLSVAGALVFFAATFKILGYGICCTLLLVAVLRLLGMQNWGKVALISAGIMGFSYYLFAAVLDVPLPRGVFFS